MKVLKALTIGLGAAILGAFISTAATAGTGKSAEGAKVALRSLYLKSRVYDQVKCDLKNIDDIDFIRCAPRNGGVPGALYIYREDGAILAVNGKAMTHTAKTGGYVKDVYADEEYDVLEWRLERAKVDGEFIDIPAIFEKF